MSSEGGKLPATAKDDVLYHHSTNNILTLQRPYQPHDVTHRISRTGGGLTIQRMNHTREKLETTYLKFLDPIVKIDFILDRLEDVKEMLDDVSNEICRDGCESTW